MRAIRYDGTNAAAVADLLGLDTAPQPWTPPEEDLHPDHDPIGPVLRVPLRSGLLGVAEAWLRPGTWVAADSDRDYTLTDDMAAAAGLAPAATPARS